MEKAATIHQVHGTVAVHEWGTILLACKGEGSSDSIITLTYVLYVPQLRVNLFLVPKLRLAHLSDNIRSCACMVRICAYTAKGAYKVNGAYSTR